MKSELTLANDVNAVLAENTQNKSASIHEVKKHFQCSMCGKIYDAPSALDKHVESVHAGIKYQCNICNKAFTENSSLRRHVESVHEGITPLLCEEIY